VDGDTIVAIVDEAAMVGNLQSGLESGNNANPDRLFGNCMVFVNTEGAELLSRLVAARPRFGELPKLDLMASCRQP
jgi:hypothetical protein